MSGLLVLLVLVVVAAASVSLFVAPFLLPWAQHLRWVIVSTALPDPWGYGSAPAGLTLREATVTGVERRTDLLILTLAAESPFTEHAAFQGPSTDEITRLVQHWAKSRTPLLLIADPDGAATLHGPTGCVVGLRASAERPERIP